MDTNIIIHHVGGRNGSTSFNFSKYFKNNFTTVLYEPDTDALETMESYCKENYDRYYILPYCLDSTISSKILNINRDPFTSSLLKQNPRFKDYYYVQSGSQNNYDYVWGETTETIIETTVKTTTLDTILKTENIPTPDILSIDTQGSEYAILKGSENTLTKVLAIISEVEFSPLYENQALFGDICHFLYQFGFEFVSFDKLKEMSEMSAPIVARGKGSHMFSDALFVKSFEKIKIDFPHEMERKLAVLKLAFFLITSGYIEKAIKLLQASDALTLVNENNHLLKERYIKFCNDFYSKIYSVNNSLNRMPTFAETFTLDQSMGVTKINAQNIMPSLSKKNSNSWFLLKNMLRKTPLRFCVHLLRRIFHTISEAIFLRRNTRHTAIEELLFHCGLSNVANLVKQNRLKCSLGLYRNRCNAKNFLN